MAPLTDASAMDNIDSALRLSGLIFPSDRPVLGKKNTDLMIALGAVNPQRHRANEQLAVVRRLCVLFDAAISTYKDSPTVDLNSDRFYAEILGSIYGKHHDMCKYLTPTSLCLALDIYVKAFARSGWKRVKRNPEPALPHNDTGEESLEILEPIQPVADRVKLEKLVKQWMVVRGIARRDGTTNKKPVFHLFKNVAFPQQKPDKTLDAYMLRLQHEFRQLNRSKHADTFVLSYVSDQRRERLDDQYDQIAEYEQLLDQRRERIDKHGDEIEEYKRRLATMQQTIDSQGDVLERHDELVRRYDELSEKLGQARLMQTMIMEWEINAAYSRDEINDKLEAIKDGQHEINGKLDEVMEGQDYIVDTQAQITEEMRITRLTQGYVVGRQDEVMRRQAVVMDSVRELMNRFSYY